ncbi:MAG: SRPBCC domain-containing protein [Ignavibacteriaceae bacterium]|nr:SRPBCC domain-containing protein [Ignavibacteriaceae bacterium]
MFTIIIVVLLATLSFTQQERSIVGEVSVPAPVAEVYNAWTTEDGAKTFFAPDCKIVLKAYGEYEMYFLADAEPGSRGGEGCKVLGFEKNKMLSFTWNAPPSLPDVRKHFTHVTVYFLSVGDSVTKVKLIHDGWGAGDEWDKAFNYFSAAWLKIVLPRLKYRFEHGPVNWDNPPKLN